ncbi:MAG: TlpA family protein disulfide reductase [Gemmatimonadaceae bacterium]|jgi:thiol-disulfide isomerase/thioredoxin|nr:TlpA family protein disulfide reductase [Gemmatimonadaceae bacterium]
MTVPTRLRSRHALLAVCALLFVPEAGAQTPPAQTTRAPSPRSKLSATTPSACLTGANDWLNRRVADLRASGTFTNATFSPLRAESVALAAQCATQFSIDRIPPDDLAALGQLYTFVGDTANARRAVERGLIAPGLSPRARGAAYLQAIALANRSADPFAGRVVRAEELVARVDALPDSLIDIKLRAHSSMLGQYEYADVNDGIRDHAIVVRDLARRIKDQPSILQAYVSLARAAADVLHPDSALRILDQADAELGGAEFAKESLGEMRSRYRLVGTKATPIVGEHWINAPDVPGAVPVGQGKVTIIEFTAHWCAPCRNSYPGMLELSKRFPADKFETVLVTDLYGYLGSTKMTAEEEIAADRVYYADHHGLPFRVAIARANGADVSPAQRLASNDARYHVGGIPQIIIVGPDGIIRQIVVGWDHGNTARFTSYIEKLLAGRID